jgi:hypothetical protein
LAYVLEFFFVASDGRQTRLDVHRRKFTSVERAETYARIIARNVKLKDQLANLCVVRDNRGRMLSEVVYAPAALASESRDGSQPPVSARVGAKVNDRSP